MLPWRRGWLWTSWYPLSYYQLMGTASLICVTTGRAIRCSVKTGITHIKIVRVVHGQTVLMNHIRVDSMIRQATLGCIPRWEIGSSIVDGILRIKQVAPRKSKLLAGFLPCVDARV